MTANEYRKMYGIHLFWSSRFRVQGLGLRGLGSRFGVQGLGFRVQGLGLRG
jgi:hypothetical protein